MTVDQFAWWMALSWFYAWTVRHPRVTIRAAAACSCNEVGSEILAACAMQIERMERFLRTAVQPVVDPRVHGAGASLDDHGAGDARCLIRRRRRARPGGALRWRARRRSTDAAVARGLALLEAAGLDPNRFDIPGREREPISSYQAAPFVAGCMKPTPFGYRSAARQRAFDEAAAAAKAAALNARAHRAADWLFADNVPVYPNDRGWFAPDLSTNTLSDADLIEKAFVRGFPPAG